jgi:hypothetical protein
LCGPAPLEDPYAAEPYKAPASSAVLQEVQKVIDIIAREVERQAKLENVRLPLGFFVLFLFLFLKSFSYFYFIK